MSQRFIKHPSQVVAVGDIVDVYVTDVDLKRGRIQLSMLAPTDDWSTASDTSWRALIEIFQTCICSPRLLQSTFENHRGPLFTDESWCRDQWKDVDRTWGSDPYRNDQTWAMSLHLHLTGQGYRHRDQDFKQLLRQVGGLRYAPASTKNYRYTYSCQNCGQKYQRQRRIDINRFVCSRCHGKLRLLKKI